MKAILGSNAGTRQIHHALCQVLGAAIGADAEGDEAERQTIVAIAGITQAFTFEPPKDLLDAAVKNMSEPDNFELEGNSVAVALANKTARIAWAVMTKN